MFNLFLGILLVLLGCIGMYIEASKWVIVSDFVIGTAGIIIGILRILGVA